MKDQGQENIKLLKRFYEAASRGDFGAARETLDANVEWIEPNVPGLWFSGTHRGADAVWKEVLRPTADKIEKLRVDMRKFYAVGDHVIAIGYFRGRGKITGKPLDSSTAHVCTMRNGKIVRLEGFHDSDGWLEMQGVAHVEPQRLAA